MKYNMKKESNNGKEGNKPVNKEADLVYKALDTMDSNFTTYR
jgi:hypothetical protein